MEENKKTGQGAVQEYRGTGKKPVAILMFLLFLAIALYASRGFWEREMLKLALADPDSSIVKIYLVLTGRNYTTKSNDEPEDAEYGENELPNPEETKQLFPQEMPTATGSISQLTIPDELKGEDNQISGTGNSGGMYGQLGSMLSSVPSQPAEKLQKMAELMQKPVYKSYMAELSEAIMSDTGSSLTGGNFADILKRVSQSPKALKVAQKYAKNPEFLKILEEMKKTTAEGMSGANEDQFQKVFKPSVVLPPASQTAGNARQPNNYSLQIVNEEDDDSDGPSATVPILGGQYDKRGASAPNTSAGLPFDE